MPDYTVTWTINVYAENPAGAAMAALETQLDPDSTARIFSVDANHPDIEIVTVDLNATDLLSTMEHDDDCIENCPIDEDEKCRIGHSCWCGSELLHDDKVTSDC